MNLIKQLGISLLIIVGISAILYFSYRFGYSGIVLLTLFLVFFLITLWKEDWEGLEVYLISWGIFYVCVYWSQGLFYLSFPLILVYYLLHKKILQYIITCPVAAFKSFLYQVDNMIILESYETTKFIMLRQGMTEQDIKTNFQDQYGKRIDINNKKINEYKQRGADFDIYKGTLGISKNQI